MSLTIPIIPPETNDANLIATINDRIRKINQALGASSASGSGAESAQVFRAALANQPLGLTKSDAGVLWHVTDYAHLLMWTGAGWEFVDGGGNFIAGRSAPPDGAGWQLCDGTATTYLHIASGVVSKVSFTTPNLVAIAQYPRFAAAYTGSVIGATAPGTTKSGATSSGAAFVASVDATGQPAHVDLIPYYRR